MSHNNTPPGFPAAFYATHVMETVQQALTESKAAIERLVAERRVLQADVARYRAVVERALQAVVDPATIGLMAMIVDAERHEAWLRALEEALLD
jgi:hypothetical protein